MAHTVLLAFLLSIICSTRCLAVSFDWATIGNLGNPDDILGFGKGAVDYVFRISKHEVTNAKCVEFLNDVASTDNFGGREGSRLWSTAAHLDDHPVEACTFKMRDDHPQAHPLGRLAIEVHFEDVRGRAALADADRPFTPSAPHPASPPPFVQRCDGLCRSLSPSGFHPKSTQDEWVLPLFGTGRGSTKQMDWLLGRDDDATKFLNATGLIAIVGLQPDFKQVRSGI